MPVSERNDSTIPGFMYLALFFKSKIFSSTTENDTSRSPNDNSTLALIVLRFSNSAMFSSISCRLMVAVLSASLMRSCKSAPSSPGNAVPLLWPSAKSEPITASVVPLQR